MDLNFDHQMSLSKSKCWHSNKCLQFLKVCCSIKKLQKGVEVASRIRAPHFFKVLPINFVAAVTKHNLRLPLNLTVCDCGKQH